MSCDISVTEMMLKKVVYYLALLSCSLTSAQSMDICQDQEDGARLAHPNDCTRFIQCYQGETVAIRYCPFGLHFNRYESICDFKFRAGCDINYALQSLSLDSGNSLDCNVCRAKCSRLHQPISLPGFLSFQNLGGKLMLSNELKQSTPCVTPATAKPTSFPCATEPTRPSETTVTTKPSYPTAPTPCPTKPSPSTKPTASTPCSTKTSPETKPTPSTLCSTKPSPATKPTAPIPSPSPSIKPTASRPCSTKPSSSPSIKPTAPTPCPSKSSSSTKPTALSPCPSKSSSETKPTAPTPCPSKSSPPTKPSAPTPCPSKSSSPTKPTASTPCSSSGGEGNDNPPSPVDGCSPITCVSPGKCAGQRNGALLADDNSNGYIVCQCGCETKMPCPEGLVFNIKLQVCDWPQS